MQALPYFVSIVKMSMSWLVQSGAVAGHFVVTFQHRSFPESVFGTHVDANALLLSCHWVLKIGSCSNSCLTDLTWKEIERAYIAEGLCRPEPFGQMTGLCLPTR